MAHLRPDAGGDTLQPAESTQHDKCWPARAGLVVCAGSGRRRPGRDSAGVEQHSIWRDHLECGLRGGRANWQAVVAVGSRSESGGRMAEDLLRHRQPRRGDRERDDHRASDRWPAGSAGCDDRQSDMGSTGCLYAGLVRVDDGAADRGEQSRDRGGGRRSSDSRIF